MQNISVQELKQRKDANETLYILDVREPHEYAEVNMGALLIPLGQVMQGQIDDIEDWKDKEVIVHCRSGSEVPLPVCCWSNLVLQIQKILPEAYWLGKL
jgi:rhodanese-related sulfurtransferase